MKSALPDLWMISPINQQMLITYFIPPVPAAVGRRHIVCGLPACVMCVPAYVGLFCRPLCLWMDIQWVCVLHQYFLWHWAFPLGQRNRWSSKTHSQQSLSCHWTAATWLDSSSAKVFERSDVSVFRWTILAPVRDESLIWWVTAPKSFKLQGPGSHQLSGRGQLYFFYSELGVKHQNCSYYINQASI